MPDELGISGYCNEDDSSLTLTFSGFQLTLFFAKTPGGERYYLSGGEVKYSTDNKLFEHIDRTGIDVNLATAERSTLLFPTPVGKSFICSKEFIITMSSQVCLVAKK